MANITSVETQNVQAGEVLGKPLGTIECWPSLNPDLPTSFHNMGIHLGEGIQQQLGTLNTLGLTAFIGKRVGSGGQVNAEPKQKSVSPKINMASPSGNLWGPWRKNGSSICTAPCSDRTAKKNIEQLDNSLNKILNLRGVSFDWDENVVPQRAKEESRQIGLIAQEVEEIVPEVVKNEIVENKELKSIKYENLTSLLIEAVKEQQEQINLLQQTVQELSTKLAECCP